MRLVTPAIRANGTTVIPRPRGVEDAAPYGRQRNVGISIAVNRCANAPNLRPPLGSPERGAVAALCAVTEGLVPAWVQCNNVARQPHPTVGAGFHARPALVKGRRGCARMKWCAGGAREIEYVWRRTLPCAPYQTPSQSATPNVRNRSTAAVTQRQGGCGGGVARGTAVARHSADGAPRTVRPTTCGERFCIAITSSVIQRKGRRGRRPLRWVQ